MANTPKTAKKTVDQIQAENTAKFMAGAAQAETAETAEVKNPDGSTGTDIAANAKKAEAAEAKAKKDAEKAAKKAEADAAKAAKVAATAEARVKAKAEREARLEALKSEGKNYVGSMLALADRVKSGAYVKGLTGQLRSNDELAITLDGVGPDGVIQLAKHVLAIEENPYTKLNIGQQSMNFRNRMRGALKKGTLTFDQIKAAIVELDIDATELIQKAAVEKAARIAARKAEAEAKAAAKAAKPVKAEAEAEAA